MSWQAFVAVAFGGAVGATTRYGVSLMLISKSGFPLATLTVNLVGSFLVGVCYVVIVERMIFSDLWRPLLVVGMMGGLTTFSTFSLEVVNLLQQGRLAMGLGYIVLSFGLCVAAAFAAIHLTRLL